MCSSSLSTFRVIVSHVRIFGRLDSKKGDGIVGILTKGVIDRAAYYSHALVLALIPFVNTEMY